MQRREYRDRAIDQFEQLWADAHDAAGVMALAVHFYIMGAPHRLRYVKEALDHITARPGVPFWTGEQILDVATARCLSLGNGLRTRKPAMEPG